MVKKKKKMDKFFFFFFFFFFLFIYFFFFCNTTSYPTHFPVLVWDNCYDGKKHEFISLLLWTTNILAQ